jgi:hypothetical protein
VNVTGRPTLRRAQHELHALIAANAALWAGEAAVFAAYFDSPARSAASDCAWLSRQCYKELIDGVATRLARVCAEAPSFAATDASAVAALGDGVVREELRHYVAFAIAHRIGQAAAGAPAAAHESFTMGANWAENVELMELRRCHVRDHGELGRRAQALTEGGYCTLYLAGARLQGGSALDRAIATACTQVLDDEWEHMLEGIAGLVDAPLEAADWATLERLSVEQGRCRIRMRNAQFGHPLTDERIAALAAGAAPPLAFDYARAGLLAP